MAHNTIAIIADCDDTLAPDTTLQLLNACGVDGERFFREDVAPYVQDGWDPTLAYLHVMIQQAREGGPLAQLTKDRILEVAQNLTFYPGVPECFTSLKDEIEGEPEYRDVGIRVECYVISGGIEELLAASSLRNGTHAIWGCNFSYDDVGRPAFPKRVISFTDKTRYVFFIQKGKVGQEFRNMPYAVNEPMDEDERPIPLRNMIYVGDGPSDIPCMSLVQNGGGYVMGILSKEKPYKTWALSFGRRANVTVPPEFEPEGYAYNQLRQALIEKASDIRRRLTRGGPVPGH